jgi:D-3-phosphoglycerate dehydrogenase
MNQKIAITDYTFDTLDIETGILAPLGCEIVAWKRVAPPSELAQMVGDADHIITQFARVNAEVIGAMRRAKVIVRYGVGVDNIDLEAARARGIPVCNVPDYCMDEVADHTLALILASTRQLPANNSHIRNGGWGLAVPLAAMKSLADLTVGVLGFGRIGSEVVGRLRAFKCRILVYDPVVPATGIVNAGAQAAGFEVVLRHADVLTLHCPSTPQTRGIIRRDTIALMKPGAILINVGRGDLVESSALIEALRQGHLAGAGLDVFDPEPIPPDSPLLKLDSVIVSPHAASVSLKAVRRLRETVAGIVARAVRRESLPNIVNGVVAQAP